MCRMNAEVIERNPGFALYNVVFGNPEDHWFDSASVLRQLHDLGVDSLTEESIAARLDSWADDGYLWSELDCYKVSV